VWRGGKGFEPPDLRVGTVEVVGTKGAASLQGCSLSRLLLRQMQRATHLLWYGIGRRTGGELGRKGVGVGVGACLTPLSTC
jgi:hypothetical protein